MSFSKIILPHGKPDFKNVMIIPKKSYVQSRKDVKLIKNFNFKTPKGIVPWNGIPIISSNMDTVSNLETFKVLSSNKYLTCFPKHFNKLWNNDCFPSELYCVNNYMLSCGTNDYHEAILLINRLQWNDIHVKFLCVDIANGYLQELQDVCKILSDKYPGMVIAAGNVVTPDLVHELITECGVNIVKVGIGSGSVCETTLKTGVGYPQLSAVMECSHAAKEAGGYIISDGGVRSVCDVTKAFAGGADFVMIGGMFAGHEESPGEIIGGSKVCYGMSSHESMNKYGINKEYRTSEGKCVSIPLKGPLQNTILDINGGIRSACTYVNARNLTDFYHNASFVITMEC